jgi:hypothetical protein
MGFAEIIGKDSVAHGMGYGVDYDERFPWD